MNKSLTVRMIADQIQASENYVRDQLKAGELEGWQLGNDWRVEPEDLKAWKERRKGAKKEPKVSGLRALEGGKR